MAKSKHSKGIWAVETGCDKPSVTVNGLYIADQISGSSWDEVHGNAKRIVDCVNALDGLNPSELPKVVVALLQCMSELDQYSGTSRRMEGDRVKALKLAEKALRSFGINAVTQKGAGFYGQEKESL